MIYSWRYKSIDFIIRMFRRLKARKQYKFGSIAQLKQVCPSGEILHVHISWDIESIKQFGYEKNFSQLVYVHFYNKYNH